MTDWIPDDKDNERMPTITALDTDSMNSIMFSIMPTVKELSSWEVGYYLHYPKWKIVILGFIFSIVHKILRLPESGL